MVQGQGDRWLRIGELAREAGLRASTIRYYERRGLLPPPWRGSRGQRRYDPDSLARLAFIRFASRSAGLTLAEIRRLQHGFCPSTAASIRWRSIRAAKLRALDETIRQAKAAQRVLRATRACRCRDLEECGRRIRAVATRR